MTVSEIHTNEKMSNLLLIAGNGRNVGKTYFACEIIKSLAQKTVVYGLKISSHFHPVSNDSILEQNDKFTIAEETKRTRKDSSRMLQAGAKKVYFLMAPQTHLLEAFNHMSKLLPEVALVCESGGLHEFIQPGLFFFVNKNGASIKKHEHLQYKPIMVNNSGIAFNFNPKNIKYTNDGFGLNNE